MATEETLVIAQHADRPEMMWLSYTGVIERVRTEDDDDTPGWLPLWPVACIVAGLWLIGCGVIAALIERQVF